MKKWNDWVSREEFPRLFAPSLGVTIQSRYQDDAFVNAVRSSVTGELSRRIGAVKHQLAELGVTSFTKEQ